jgi:CO dehydrogenase/acetyl-CoA synthase gamma subunit (corrinoid Fe-S protein)
MENADLYLNKIDFASYLSEADCRKCGADSCRDLVDKLKRGDCSISDLDEISHNKADALQFALESESRMPRVPKLQLPKPGQAGLIELNNPSDGDPILVTGNNMFTLDIMLFVLSKTISPFYLVSADTQGDSLDMAIILGSYTSETVREALELDNLPETAGSSNLIIPGRASYLAKSIKAATGFQVIVGPICAAELPLYFGDKWQTG